MKVEYTGRQTTITKKLKAQAEAGLERIVKLVGTTCTVHVVLSVDKYRQIADVLDPSWIMSDDIAGGEEYILLVKRDRFQKLL